MLELAIISLVISILAGGMGFTGLARGARTVALTIFGVFLAIALFLFLLLILGVRLLGS